MMSLSSSEGTDQLFLSKKISASFRNALTPLKGSFLQHSTSQPAWLQGWQVALHLAGGIPWLRLFPGSKQHMTAKMQKLLMLQHPSHATGWIQHQANSAGTGWLDLFTGSVLCPSLLWHTSHGVGSRTQMQFNSNMGGKGLNAPGYSF